MAGRHSGFVTNLLENIWHIKIFIFGSEWKRRISKMISHAPASFIHGPTCHPISQPSPQPSPLKSKITSDALWVLLIPYLFLYFFSWIQIHTRAMSDTYMNTNFSRLQIQINVYPIQDKLDADIVGHKYFYGYFEYTQHLWIIFNSSRNFWK